jgi:hypothetical protein
MYPETYREIPAVGEPMFEEGTSVENYCSTWNNSVVLERFRRAEKSNTFHSVSSISRSDVPRGTSPPSNLSPNSRQQYSLLQPRHCRSLPPVHPRQDIPDGLLSAARREYNHRSAGSHSFKCSPTGRLHLIHRPQRNRIKNSFCNHRFYPPGEHLCLQCQCPNSLSQKSSLFPLRFSQRHANLRSAECNGNPRKPRTRSKIQQSFRMRGNLSCCKDALQKVSLYDLSRLPHRSQIQLRIPSHQ